MDEPSRSQASGADRSAAAGDPGLPADQGPAGIRPRGQRTDQPQGRPRLSGARRHPDHAARGSAQAGRNDAPSPTEIRLNKAERVLACRVRRRRAFRAAGRVSAGGKPERRGAGPRPAPEADRRRQAGCRRSSAIEPVGNYAVRLMFDDLHDTGIYSWDYLHELGREQEQPWPAYLAALDGARAASGARVEPAQPLSTQKLGHTGAQHLPQITSAPARCSPRSARSPAAPRAGRSPNRGRAAPARRSSPARRPRRIAPSCRQSSS